MLDQLDLVHMNGRVYDPLTAKFLSGDPFIQDPLNGQGYNRYSYVMNNPTNLTDPSGFATATCNGEGKKEDCKPPSSTDNRDEREAKRMRAAGWFTIFAAEKQKSNTEVAKGGQGSTSNLPTEKDRRMSIVGGTPGSISIADNSGASGTEPFYECPMQ